MAKSSELPCSNGKNWSFDYDNGQNSKITVVEWSKLANFDHLPLPNFRVSWSWSIL